MQNKNSKGANCFIDYHNKNFYGLAKCDCILIPDKLAIWMATWEYPIKWVKKVKANYINELQKQGLSINDNNSV